MLSLPMDSLKKNKIQQKTYRSDTIQEIREINSLCSWGGILEAGFHGPNVPSKISWQGLPCLVQTSPAFPGCKGEALCIEAPERKKKSCICVNLALLKDAIGFFLEHGHLEELGDCGLPVRRNAHLISLRTAFS